MVHIAAVDVFCGIGGLTRGLTDVGIDVVAGIDMDESCEYAYTANNAAWFISADVREITGDDLAKLYPAGALRMLAGCAPCQPFSQLTKKIKKNDPTAHSDDTRHSLLGEFGRLIRELGPDIVTMENVPNVMQEPVFEAFLSTLAELEYAVEYRVINCVDYGVPQSRRRFVLFATRGTKVDFPEPTSERLTLKDAIGKLPRLANGKANASDPLHKARKLGPLNMQRIRQSKPGGTWKDWDKELRSPCHTVDSGVSFRAVYGRMSYSRPSSTITTQFFNFGTGRFGHPTQDRTISLREAALIQTFPPDYDFVPVGEEIFFSIVGRQIGNAVPVELGRVIGQAILDAASDKCVVA